MLPGFQSQAACQHDYSLLADALVELLELRDMIREIWRIKRGDKPLRAWSWAEIMDGTMEEERPAELDAIEDAVASIGEFLGDFETMQHVCDEAADRAGPAGGRVLSALNALWDGKNGWWA